ncbi:MAG TPA: redox-sensing transcriptional repressor Rex [Aggregatilineaceae bacterium]|nr:redox-sensing transcriptional repressor Rex [Aggregatilineaceae bacterium]
MAQVPTIPDIVIGRLPIYLRALNRMIQEGREYTSSHELGERLGISSAQIRKDLSHFGEFGKQGTGYHVNYLYEQIQHILKVDRQWPMAVVGIGDLGRAVANYKGFAARGFVVAALFDDDPSKIGEEINGMKVLPTSQMAEEIQRRGIKMAMIAVPLETAQAVANQLATCGVRAILNYAPITLAVPEGVQVQYIDPVAHLQHMTFYLNP